MNKRLMCLRVLNVRSPSNLVARSIDSVSFQVHPEILQQFYLQESRTTPLSIIQGENRLSKHYNNNYITQKTIVVLRDCQ